MLGRRAIRQPVVVMLRVARPGSHRAISHRAGRPPRGRDGWAGVCAPGSVGPLQGPGCWRLGSGGLRCATTTGDSLRSLRLRLWIGGRNLTGGRAHGAHSHSNAGPRSVSLLLPCFGRRGQARLRHQPMGGPGALEERSRGQDARAPYPCARARQDPWDRRRPRRPKPFSTPIPRSGRPTTDPARSRADTTDRRHGSTDQGVGRLLCRRRDGWPRRNKESAGGSMLPPALSGNRGPLIRRASLWGNLPWSRLPSPSRRSLPR